MNELVKKILNSDKRSIARGISIIENDSLHTYELLKLIYKYTGKSYIIGITGPPGAGKSTITNSLTKLLLEKNYSVGIIAVDPTSPFTGGALLGDRIRMQEIGLNEKVFIRSMATRGSLGGLSEKAKEACEILDASGKDFIIIETVGVGQSELDIAQTADTTIVVLVPESGDAVQTMKAGLMEIGDMFVINKSDRDGADVLSLALKTMLHYKMKESDDREINVLKTVGTLGTGLNEVLDEILNHKNYLETKGILWEKRKEHLIKKMNELVNLRLKKVFWTDDAINLLNQNIDKLINRELNPYNFIEDLFKNYNNS